MRVPTGAIALVAVLLLAGCTPTGSPAPPDPSPAPTRVDVPADPDTWLISFDGIGPVTVGLTQPRIAETVPFPGGPEQTCPRMGRWDLGGGLSLRSLGDSATALSTVVAIDGRGSEARGPRTSAGIGIGSTVDDVIAAYPNAQSGKVGDKAYYRLLGPGPASKAIDFVFTIDDDSAQTVVYSISVGALSAQDHEPCD